MPGGAKVEFTNVAATNWIGGELVLKYTTTTGSHGFTLPEGTTIADVLVVGGGGAGGSGKGTGNNRGVGGGGGAGGLIETNDMLLATGTYSVSVGKGGQPGEDASGIPGGDGDDSTIVLNSADVFRAHGGGGGGAESDGNSGGSGGGGSKYWASSSDWGPRVGGSGVSGQGNKGGDGKASSSGNLGRTAGGGGGAGGPGSDTMTANVGTAGGLGKASRIWNNTEIFYAGGGGGGTASATSDKIGIGGSGIGGNGGSSDTIQAEDGKSETGSGGGGGSLKTAGGAGGSGVVIVRISAVVEPPVRPVSTTNVYDGVTHTVIAPSAAYEITGKTEGTNAGKYTATATLKPGFTWAGGGNEPVTVTLTIEKTWTEIIGLHLDSWMVGTPEEETPNPTCTVKPDCIVDQTTVSYDYQKRGSGVPAASNWSLTKPTEIGQYWVRATVAEGANNLATNAVSPFAIVDNPANVFHDYVEITIAGYDPKPTLTNYPYRVELKEGAPEGFHYYNSDGTPRAGTTGENLSFTTPEGVPLSYCVGSDGWNVKGTSVLYVQIPLIGKDPQVIRLYWAPREGTTVPPYTPDAVWTDLWPDEESTEKVTPPGKDFGMVDIDGTKVDVWVDLPEMDDPTWGETSDPSKTGSVLTNGSLKSRRPIDYAVYDAQGARYDPANPHMMPTNAGTYTVAFAPVDETGYYPISTSLTVRVVKRNPYRDLRDGARNLTVGGRVFIASGDTADGTVERKVGPEEGQAYWQIWRIYDAVEMEYIYFDTYWEHDGDHGLPSTVYPYLFAGSDHVLHDIVDNGATTNIIWRFYDVAMGNMFASNLKLNADQCYLPYSSTAYGISKYNQRNKQGLQQEVGQLQLLNVADACIYSPCYTNGIGTVYFDAVNALTKKLADDGYKIAVEISTNTTASGTVPGAIPTDANAGEDLAFGCEWHRVDMVPLMRDKGATKFTQLPATNELSLAITTGGSTDNFYRFCVPVEVDAPVRFRIRRLTTLSGQTDYLVQLDNILVTFPGNDAGVETYGRYDGAVKPSETDRAELGVKAATDTPFPSIGDGEIFGRAKPYYRPNAASVDQATNFIDVVRMHYRWRYLDQVSNDWQHVDLAKRDLGDGAIDFIATKPLALPAREGDIEYWYESFLTLPFFEYYDYSGAKAGLGSYSEEKALGTNTFVTAGHGERLSSMGKDWFFRLRPGKSDYEVLQTIVKTSSGAVFTNAMTLAADHRWRGCFKTPDADADGLWVKFAFVNRQTPGTMEYAENCAVYRLPEDVGTLPAMGSLVVAGDEWTHLPCDGLTGYLLFQVEDESLGITIVHADRQNFDYWNDALRSDYTFVGTSTETSGVALTVREFSGEIARWHVTPATNKLWNESFIVAAGDMDPGKPWEVNKPFMSAKTPNGLSSGAGQWVTGLFRATSTGMALQMDGTGGYLQFIDAAATPRGIETIRFTTRLAQATGFEDFCYYDGGDKAQMKKYTFMARGAYDLKTRTTFSGNASLSLVAGYRPGIGCYELRVEQENATASFAAGTTQRLSIYRWRYDDTAGEMVPKRLKTATSSKTDYLNTSDAFGNYSLLFIAIDVQDGKTIVNGGLTTSFGVDKTADGQTAYGITYTDSSADLLKGGTYGLLMANCDGRFVKPCIAMDTAAAVASSKFTEPSSTSCKEALGGESWVLNQRRVSYFYEDDYFFGLKAVPPQPQPLVVYTAPAGTENWTAWKTTNITSYANERIVYNLWSMDEKAIRIAPGGTSKKRTDVVIDDFELRQWRGESWNDPNQASVWTDYDLTYGAPTNFVFTQGWIGTNETEKIQYCQLNAKRALPNKSQSIRSPLFDGGTDRGLGLGMISFSYENAQENANISLQIATNDVTLTGLKNLTDDPPTSPNWTTVTNFSFAGVSEDERRSGTRAYYLGLHGVKGVMRLVITNVAEVASSSDPDRFGSIDITGVVCRDEPNLDRFAWWGWNLRTTDQAPLRNLNDYYADESKKGLACALNNSVDKILGELADEPEVYLAHLPYVQTPQFAGDVVGEVSFKARKYRIGDPDTQVVLFGAKTGVATDDGWDKLKAFPVVTDTYQTFTYKTMAGQSYSAFRFVVTGVDGVVEPKMDDPDAPANPRRVLIDDVLVMEAIRAKVAFRNVAAFRGYLDSNTVVPDIMDKSHQPLCKEAFSVQCEVYAAQLASEVDLSNAKVTLWWYVGEKPWGFDKWQDDPKAHHAVLAECDGTNLVFRGGYAAAPEAVIGEEQKPTPVQYMLKVEFRNSDGSKGESTLKEADWTNPPWYEPVDYNRTHDDFSAYTLLDSVPSGWAWINEVNIYGTEDRWGLNTDEALQFVEIAAPVDADLTGWTVRFLDGQNANNRVVTNVVAKFGVQLPATKENPRSVASNCTFHVIASPESKGSFDASDGRVDGVWMVENDNNAVSVTRNNRGGVIQKSYPIGIQLVRPSGIVEHELVAVGTNRYEATHEVKNDPEAKVELLNRLCGKGFFYAGQDSGGVPVVGGWSTSVGAMRNNGSPSSVFETNWSNEKLMTPGRINEGQEIEGAPPSPFGSSIRITSVIRSGHLLHTFGEMTEPTNAVSWIIYPKGSETGTNITYYADRWYVPATSVGTPVPAGAPGVWTLEVGKAISNDVTVTANAAPDPELVEKYGLGPDNRYAEAVVEWLSGGRTLGGEFANPDYAEPGLGDFYDLGGRVAAKLDLTTMYWLDMDPSYPDGVMSLRGGMHAYSPSDPTCNKYVEYPDGSIWTNRLLTVELYMTNTASGETWAPYVLRGEEPGVMSWDYAEPTSTWSWASANFKVTGILVNDLSGSGLGDRSSWKPLRWFVFDGRLVDGKPETKSFDEDYRSVIEISDPYKSVSAWKKWCDEHPGKEWPIWHSWDIDDRLMPVKVELLRPENEL